MRIPYRSKVVGLDLTFVHIAGGNHVISCAGNDLGFELFFDFVEI